MTSRLAQYAIKRGIKVAFVSSPDQRGDPLLPFQLIELAKLLGVKEDYARNAVCVTNAELIE
jgi:hypothetical protein